MKKFPVTELSGFLGAGKATVLESYAGIFCTDHSTVNLNHVLNSKAFNFEKVSESRLWLKELPGKHRPETEENMVA